MEDKDFILLIHGLYESSAKIIGEDAKNLKTKLDSLDGLSTRDLEVMLLRIVNCSGELGMIHDKLTEYLESRKDSKQII